MEVQIKYQIIDGANTQINNVDDIFIAGNTLKKM